ncbi:DUF6461 domain-containing protein [Nonomuraea sp. NPDC050790]|uniref:DUF6461 domain-containing protein n=1 Tax=Nonomuraea sp. NPDC050790 TaxID=3364371 RepID=UPI0037A95CF6
MTAAMPTTTDYAWADGGALDDPYCLTLVRGLTPEEFMARVDAQTRSRRRLGEGVPFGAAAVPGADWTLVYESDGRLGVTAEAMIPVSTGTRVVSHCEVGNGRYRFFWAEDGDVRLDFDPLYANDRRGSTPDALLTDMVDIGYDLRDDATLEDVDFTFPLIAASFALAERLTGLRITPELLGGLTFLCGEAPSVRP